MLKFLSSRKKGPLPGILGEKTLLHHFSTRSSYAESYRTLRTNLHFSLMDKELGSLVVTSSLPGEGKSNTVANLAYTIGQAGKSVLMIDADLRKPGLSARFSAKNNTAGLSQLISETLGQYLKEGNISEYGLIDIVTLCSLQKRSCVIDMQEAENQTTLFFHKGELVDIHWKNRPGPQKLASSLISEKLLTKEEASLALTHQQKSLRRLGSILLTMGFVTEKDLARVLSGQRMEALKVTATMLNGSFSCRALQEGDIDQTSNRMKDFKNLYNEFIGVDGRGSYIKKAIDESILKTEHENLYILPAGKIPPNPAELINSDRTSYLLNVLKKNFDMILIDTSPVMPASDALLLAPQTDGVVIVTKSGAVNKPILQDVVSQLKNSKAHILGVILNHADKSESGYYKYYKSYYGS